jgi:hypothetical protein
LIGLRTQPKVGRVTLFVESATASSQRIREKQGVRVI